MRLQGKSLNTLTPFGSKTRHCPRRLRQERLRQERLRQERLRQERLRQERLRQERLRQERLRQERLRQERLRQERLRQTDIKENKGLVELPAREQWISGFSLGNSQQLPEDFKGILELESVQLGSVSVDFTTLTKFVTLSGKLGVRLKDKDSPSWFEVDKLSNELHAHARIDAQTVMTVKLRSAGGTTASSCDLSVSAHSSAIGFDSRDLDGTIVLVNKDNEPLVRVPFLPLQPKFARLAEVDGRLTFDFGDNNSNVGNARNNFDLFKAINETMFKPMHSFKFEMQAEPVEHTYLILELKPTVPDSNTINYPILAIEIQEQGGQSRPRLELHLFKNLLSKRQLDKGNEVYKVLDKPGEIIGKKVEFEVFRDREVVRSGRKRLKDFSDELAESAENVRNWFNGLILELAKLGLKESAKLSEQIREVGIRHESVSELGGFLVQGFREGLAEKLNSIVIPVEVRDQDGWHLYLVKVGDWNSAEKGRVAMLVKNRLFELLQQK